MLFGIKRYMNHRLSIPLLGRLRWILPAALAAMLIAGCVPAGMRLLRMEVYQDDQLVLRTTFDAPDREGPADFWRRAGAEPFASDEKIARVKADEDNPLRASLIGPVRIRILHVDRIMTSASITNSVLLRKTRESLGWYLAPVEVQRAKRAAGL
jgi:hypothetical protein